MTKNKLNKLKEMQKENRKRLGKIDIEEIKTKILNKLTDENKVQYYLFFDIIKEFCGENYIMNNFIQMVKEIDDKKLLNKLDRFIDIKIKNNKTNWYSS